jgi:hypothetical protein
MKLHEILEESNILVPNSLSDKKKVEWLNTVQRQSYRDFGFPDTSHSFQVNPGVSLYVIPDNCSRERITNLIVGEREYSYQTVDEDAKDYAWTIVDEMLWIYPTPNNSEYAYLNYRPRPDDMREEMQEIEPQFPVDFHELLVFGIAARIARASQDSAKAAEMELQYEILHEKAKKSLRPSRQKTTRQSRSWR